MTTVTIYQTKNGIYKGFELSGHAGYATSGADIVCAAISMLTTNTINSIETFTDDFFSYEENEETGYMKLMLDENASDKSQLLISSMVLGLSQLEKSYRKYVRLKNKEV